MWPDSLPFLVLKRYVPKVWDAKMIGTHLVGYTASLGLIPSPDQIHGPIHWKKGWFSEAHHAEVRRRTSPKLAAGDWHQDGDTTPGSIMDCALVLWANRTPTEFKWEGKIYQPLPFEVIIARNLACHHRRPKDAPFRRWMFRQRVLVPKWKELP